MCLIHGTFGGATSRYPAATWSLGLWGPLCREPFAVGLAVNKNSRCHASMGMIGSIVRIWRILSVQLAMDLVMLGLFVTGVGGEWK